MPNKICCSQKIGWNGLNSILLCLLTIQPANALTFVLDFNDPDQPNTKDRYNAEVATFDVTDYRFDSDQFDFVTKSIVKQTKSYFYDLPTISEDSRSPIPDGQELDIDFVVGDILDPPSNGDTEHYFIQIGSRVNSSSGALGQAGLGIARSRTGVSNPFSVSGDGLVVGSVFTNRINNLGGLGATKPLKSGNLFATTQAIAGTLAHEIGHTLSLGHVLKSGSVTPGDVPPLLGTGALDLPNRDRIIERSFSFSAIGESTGFNDEHEHLDPSVPIITDSELLHVDVGRDPLAPLQSIPLEDAATVNNIELLTNSVGLRDVPTSIPWNFSPLVSIVAVCGGLITSRKSWH